MLRSDRHRDRVLNRGDLVPHFEVTTTGGACVRYADHWQRRNLLLIALPASGAEDYIRSLERQMPELTAHDTVCVITRDSIRGIDALGVVVADKWGEIHHVAHAKSAADLPGPEELIEWLRWVNTRHSRSGLAPNTHADDHPSDGALAPRRALLKVMRVAPIID